MGKLYSASVQIRDPKGNYLWIRRSPTARSRAGHYEHSGGRSEPGETAREAAVREIREETGIKIREDELRLVDRKTGPKGDHVTFSHVVRKAVIPKLSFEHDAYVWSPEKPALTNGFLSKYMQGKDTSAMTTQEKAKKAAIGVATTAATRAAGKAIAKKMAAKAAASAAVKVGTAGTGVGIFVTGGMMVADAAPEAWAVAKEADAHRKQTWSEVREAKGAGAKLKAAALGGGKGFLHMSTAPLRVGAASIFGSGTVKMAREAAGEAMSARKGARQNGVGTSLVRVMGKAAGHAPAVTGHAGTLLREGGKLVGLAATTVIGGTVALKTAKAAWRDAKKNPSSAQEAPNSQAFRRWFKGSKVVDEAGKPLVVYHGTKYDFTAFDKSRLGSFTEHPTATLGFMFSPEPRIAAQFAGKTNTMSAEDVSKAISSGKMKVWDAFNVIQTGEKQIAVPNDLWSGSLFFPVEAGANILPVYLSIQKPLVIPWKEYYVTRADPEARLKVERIRQRAIQGGHDGIYVPPVPGAEGDEEGHGIWVAFEPTQIKSAVGNVGTFDSKDPNMVRNPKTRKPSSIAANVAEINKMLKNMPSDWQTQLSINRAELKAAGADSSQLPPASPNAHNILLSLNLNNRGEVSSEAAAGQEPTSGQTVPDDVREAAMEGVRLSYQNNYGGYHMIGLARAIQLAISPKISDAALNRMRMYFDRKTKQDRMSDQYANKHGKRYWSWLNWGGDPGARWSGSKRFAQLVKENPMSAYSRHNPFDNPYHKKEIGPQGTVCFYIYNDDGSKVVGPTGPKYCYSLDKAEDFVRKAERAGHRVSPSDVSPGSRKAQKATAERRAPVSGPMQYIEDRFELLRPILNQHLVMSVERPHRDGVGSRGKARTVQGIQPRTIYAVIHTGLRADGTVRPSFVVNMATMEISRADAEGRPREAWNYGTIDEVIARGKTLKPRNNPAAYTLVGDGHGVRLRDLVREGQGAELHESTKAKKSQGAQARGKKAKAKSKRNPSPGFTTEEWLADVEGEEWANYDLNRAGIMHYSGSGIPTYRSLYR